MKIAVAADERTGVADAVVEELRRRGHEPLAARRARPTTSATTGRGPPRPPPATSPTAAPSRASSAAGPAPAPRSPPTRSAASAPRSAATPPPPGRAQVERRQRARALPARHLAGGARGDPRRLVRRRAARPRMDDRANVEHLAETAKSLRPPRAKRTTPSVSSCSTTRPSSSSRSTWPSTSRQRQVGLRDRDVAPQRLRDLVRGARPLGEQPGDLRARAARACAKRSSISARVVGDRLAVARAARRSSVHRARLAQRAPGR